MADEQQQEPFEEDMTCPRDHVVWSWVTPGQMLPGNSCESRRLRCKICNKEYKGNRKRAWEHFILARASSRCSGSNLSIWKRLHRIGAHLPPDLLARMQMALKQERDDDDYGVPNVAGVGPETSIKRYTKNPKQEEIDDSCCQFFVENATPFNAAKSRSFKKFTWACYGPQPAASHPLVPTGYNPLRCRLLDRLNKRLQEEEQAIRDVWQVTGCTFITDETTDICGRSLMNYILTGRSKPIFIKCEDVSEGTRTPQPSLPDGSGSLGSGGWRRSRCLLRPAQTRFGTHYVMLQPLEVCEKAIRRIVAGQEWEAQVWRWDIRANAFFVEETVLDRAFWANARKLTVVMKGPYDVLRKVDKDVHCLSRIYDMARRLPDFVQSAPLIAEQRDDMLRDVRNMTDMLLSPIHDVARLLDPQLRDITLFSDVNLITQFESVVERLIGKKGSSRFNEWMDQLYDFQFGKGVLGTPQAKKRATKDNAVLWWEAHGAGHPEIRELAIRVLSIWMTSSPAERKWSTWALVQTKCRNKLHHQRTNKLVSSHSSLRLKSRGDEGPTIAGGWLGLAIEWADEDLGGDLANVIEAVDDYELAVGDASSAVGSTTVRHDPVGPSTSRSMQRLRHAEEVEEEEDNEEADVEDDDEEEVEDDIPGEEWVVERSDSDRSWTRREDAPYVRGTGYGLRSPTQPRGEEQQVEDQQSDKQQGREQQVEEQQVEEQQGKEVQGEEEQVEEEGKEDQQVEEHTGGMQQGEEQQLLEHEKEQQVEEHLVEEQQVEEQQVGEQQVEERGDDVQHLSEVRAFYGSTRQSPQVGQQGAHPGRVWDPLAYRAQRGRGRSASARARGGTARAG
ncbi:hypothetical protein CBR_g53765 [Chara braunii]|uniref:HAT C-terminal dimerisation domain-containing protein n=1 Tax=Chara braunii TaxID=69332 RepID=A0A388K6W0_CHABU|nr:hypothetical protein CBR_g53765 [Chara braunii]|eukprot:GBG65795.1 hypothetical protein CBR_g53765 [Chara braunii]